MFLITFDIDPNSQEKLYMQIYHYIRSEIESGNLKPGDRLPSTRKLATHLGVSRNTVDTAYDQLLDEGYITSEVKRGFFINAIESLTPDFSSHHGALFSRTFAQDCFENQTDSKTSEYKVSFSPYGVDLEHFPFDTWRKIAKNIFYDDRNAALFESGDPQGDFSLRSAITTYLHQSRGVVCTPDQVIVGAGIDYLLILVSQLLGNDAIYAIENPSYMRSLKVLSAAGVRTVSIEMDHDGINMLKLNTSGANVACVTPSHHFPLGIVMPVKRRNQLLSWAAEDDHRYIIEDDYDSEFRYKGKPVPCLQGLGHSDKVIYLGTFSKAIAPSIRVAYMVLPKALLERYRTHFSFYANTVARTEQKQLTDFITEGYFERHLNRMRNIYKTKRDIILKAFEPYQDRVLISGENSGLHILLTFIDGRSADDILQIALRAGIKLFDLKSFFVNQSSENSSEKGGQATIAENFCSKKKHHSRMDATVLLGYGALSLHDINRYIPELIDILFNDQ